MEAKVLMQLHFIAVVLHFVVPVLILILGISASWSCIVYELDILPQFVKKFLSENSNHSSSVHENMQNVSVEVCNRYVGQRRATKNCNTIL